MAPDRRNATGLHADLGVHLFELPFRRTHWAGIRGLGHEHLDPLIVVYSPLHWSPDFVEWAEHPPQGIEIGDVFKSAPAKPPGCSGCSSAAVFPKPNAPGRSVPDRTHASSNRRPWTW